MIKAHGARPHAVCTPWANLSLGNLGKNLGYRPNLLQLRGPASPAEAPRWLADLRRWRAACLASLQLDGSAFDAVPWARTAYMQPLSMPFDRYIYDVTTHSYTASRYLESLRLQYGGIDSVLLWPTYTNIGADDRNQFELIESMPGGIAGLKRLIDELHAAGVHVLLPYNPWDQGTHGGSFKKPVARLHAATRLASLLQETGADGFFGDTISSDGMGRFYADSVAAGRPAAIQPESGGTPGGLNFTVFGWGYWDWDQRVPPVDLLRWLEPRFLTQACDRWMVDKTPLLQLAFFNAAGVETWQSIWGIWVGLSPRDSEALKRIGAMLATIADRTRERQSDGRLPLPAPRLLRLNVSRFLRGRFSGSSVDAGTCSRRTGSRTRRWATAAAPMSSRRSGRCSTKPCTS